MCVPLNWKNNNCESINNIIKLSTNWKMLKLPDLIEKMYAIVRLQYADIRRALHGQENYQIIPKFKSFVLFTVVWSQKSEERDKYFKKFISMPVGVKQTILLSTDGDLRIPTTPTIARKPGQQKRVRNQKTVTVKPKRMKVENVEHE